MNDADIAALITLRNVEGLGDARCNALLASFGSAADVLRASVGQLRSIDGVGPKTASRIALDQSDEYARLQLESARRCGAQAMCPGDDVFPRYLSEIYDPPPLLWYRGQAEFNQPSIAVVGTRRPSDYGVKATKIIVSELVHNGLTIVSGLAYGIDTVAHETALSQGGQTIAVLGSGVDRLYPAANSRLAMSICESGSVLSEFDMGAKPDAQNFPKRNRIISGMSLGTVVVEAFSGGGALITARQALDQGREVFAIPGRIDSVCSEGTNQLIRTGQAKLVQSVDDVLEEIVGKLPGKPAPTLPVTPVPRIEVSALQHTILSVFDAESIYIDEISEKSGVPEGELALGLLELELKGLVTALAGQKYQRVVF